MTAQAQSVTITPKSGNLICALTRDTETGYGTGGSAVWRHEQLGLTMICSDRKIYSDEGIVTDLGNNLFEMNETTFQLVGGMIYQSYVQIFLPKGYRFTSYTIDVQNNIPEDYNDNEGWCSHSKPYYFGETDANHNYKDELPCLSLGTEVSDTKYRIARTSTGTGDMGNVLCFKLATDKVDESSAIYMAISLTNITVTYTTEEPDEVGTLAEFDEHIVDGVSCTTFPFYTGRVDLGVIKSRTKTTTTSGYEGQTNRLSFLQGEQTDIYGDMIFYEDSCVDMSLPIAERDTMTLEGHQSITTKRYNNQYYYSLTYGENGMTYYLETPQTKKLYYDMDDDGTKETAVEQGLRYRITGGTIYYGGKYGETEVVQIVDTLNWNTYYMAANDDGEIIYTTTPTYWYHKGTGKMYTDSPNGTRYYLGISKVESGASSSGRYREDGVTYIVSTTAYDYYPQLTKDRTQATRFEIAGQQARIVYEAVDTTSIYSVSGRYPDYEYTYIRSYENDPVDYYLDLSTYRTVKGNDWKTGYRFQSSPTGNYCWAEVSYLDDEQNLAPYILTIYDKNGTDILETIKVASGAAPQSYTLPKGSIADKTMEFNNDAIKVRIEPDPDAEASEDLEYEALFYIAPVIEAISPYIDIMELKIKSTDTDIPDFVSATYTAEDFDVGGGDVTMPIPATLHGRPLKLVFDNMHTKMTDATYWNGEYKQHGRNSFVMSEYFRHFGDDNGYNNNIYNDPEYAMESDYTTKVYVDLIGNVPFKFNNAADISDVAVSKDAWTTNVFQEYKFSVEAYDNTTYNGVDGKFAEYTFTFDDGQHFVDTVYVFTADEPRYNIAPTGAIQHRFYAYYQMGITFTEKTYDPIIKFDTIYNKTFYGEKGKNLPMYGVTFYAWEDSEQTQPGYITDKQAYNAFVPYLLDNENYPDFVSGEQILYIDYSNLKGLVTTQENSWSYLKEYTSPNCLAFLPKNLDWQADNFARKLSDDDGDVFYQATNNIIIKDRYPFFSPYEIQTSSANYVKYERIVSSKKNTQVQNQTICLPVRLILKNNTYYSDSDVDKSGTSFTAWTMSPKTEIEKPSADNGHDFSDDVEFINIGRIPAEDDTETVYTDTMYANRPYFIRLTEEYYNDVVKADNSPVPDSVCFVVAQRGGTVVPSRIPNDGKSSLPDYDDPSTYTWHRGLEYMPFWTGDATLNEVGYTFTGCGTYSGTQQEDCFYYGNGYFYCSANLRGSKKANIRPFRGFVKYDTSGTPAKSFGIIFKTVTAENAEETTGISMEEAGSATIVGGKGTITVLTFADETVPVYTLSGTMAKKMRLSAGQSKTVSVPAGIYVVKGKKIVVQ